MIEEFMQRSIFTFYSLHMTYDLILRNVAKHINLNAEETDFFTSLIAQKNIRKKQLILHEGQLCRNLFYVHSGALRAYCINKEGKEATIMFAIADWWITDMYCFLNEKPAMMYIEAIEDSCLFQLTKKNFEMLLRNAPKFEKFFRVLMQNAYTREQLRIIENLTLTAENRYNNFLIKYPHIAKEVTQKQIASYLGITPEFLSSIRNNKNKRQVS